MTVIALSLALLTTSLADGPVVLPGKPTPGKHIVLVAGDEEYRSEDVMSQLARILSTHHGFKCTVLFALDADGTVNPNKSNIPGLEALKTADLLVLFTRFRDLPDEQMQHFDDYFKAGKPIVGLRTATHAFANNKNPKYSKYNYNSKEKGWEGGFGKTILGETWVSHHGKHGTEGTRAVFSDAMKRDTIAWGIKDRSIFGTSDVYTAKPHDGTRVLLYGEVTESLKPDSKAVEGKKNSPMMPIAWTRFYNKARIVTTTMGCSQDFENEAFRRFLVNSCYFALWHEATQPKETKVDIVGKFDVTPFGNKKDEVWKAAAKKPADYFK